MISTLRGFRNILPPDSDLFSEIENTAKKIFNLYGFRELRIPTLEKKELFVKSTGTSTDIVQKEMYSFTDAGGRDIANRPEGTPGIAKAYIEHNLNQSGKNNKFFYIANMFRAERPQAGRYREFEQIGAENIGGGEPESDAEAIAMLVNILKSIGVKDLVVDINSLGCEQCRKTYRTELTEYLKTHINEICNSCQTRIDQNPLRALDCKVDGPLLAASAPKMKLCPDCAKHFEGTQKFLKIAGVEYRVNLSLVRGLDYYTRTVFEVRSTSIGSQDAIAAGGRYDELVKSMGGPSVPSVGWAMGVDRVALLLKEKADTLNKDVKIFIVSATSQASEKAFSLLNNLRQSEVSCDFSSFELSLKSQMRSANKSGALFALIIGEDELKTDTVAIKDLRNNVEQKQIKFCEITEYCKTILKIS